jgi:eukaryotic-like serine/threonine-protein kinase
MLIMQTPPRAAGPEENKEPAPVLTPLESILHTIRTSDKVGFPAVSSFLRDIYKALKSEETSAQEISNLILKDVALTSAVLKTVNSSFYAVGARGQQQISTVSRCILMLGVDGIANLAAALSVFEAFKGCNEIKTLKKLTIHSLLTGSHARELSRGQEGFSNEQAFIFGVMNSLGHMVVAFYLPEKYQLIEEKASTQQLGAEAASIQVLGVGFREIAQAVAKEWHLPSELRDAISGLDLKEPASAPGQKFRALIACADDLASVATVSDPIQRDVMLESIRNRYKAHMQMSDAQIKKIVTSTYSSIGELTRTLQITRKELEEHLPGMLTANMSSKSLPAVTDPSQQPDVLLGSLDEIVGAINNEQPLNDVLMMILETIYRALNFDHVLLGLITPDRTMLKGRVCVGPRSQQMIETFQLRLQFPRTCLADVIVASKEIVAAQSAGFEHIPIDFLNKTGAKSFILLPLLMKNVSIGAIYAQRIDNTQLGEAEKRNLRLLRNYAAMAIRQCK